MNRIVGIVEFESPFRFQLPFKLAKPSFESYFLLSKEDLMCISVFENGILFAREVFSSNSAFANENLLAKNVFPHRDTKPSQIFLGWSNFYFSTRASATTVSTWNESIRLMSGIYFSFCPFGRTSRYMGFISCHLRWQRH